MVRNRDQNIGRIDVREGRAPRTIKGRNSSIAASLGLAGVGAPETPFRIDRECR